LDLGPICSGSAKDANGIEKCKRSYSFIYVQRSAFGCTDVCRQSRSFARLNQPLRQTNYSLLLSVIRLFGECLAQEARKPACKSERRYGRTKDERRTDSGSHPHGLVAGFNLVTQQNMDLWMTFHLVQGGFQGVVSQIRTFVTGTGR